MTTAARTFAGDDDLPGSHAGGGKALTPAPAPSVATRILSLRLADFRNYETLRIAFTHPFVVLVGENGAGKTNLMEAVSLLTPGRGLRRAAYGDMARAAGSAGSGGSGGFAVHARLDAAGEEVEIATLVRPETDGAAGLSRIVRINGTQAKSAEEMLDHLRIVWLTPAMDGLFTGPAGDRRRFLDRLVLTVDPAHGRRAADYERAMRQRNRLLSEHRQDDVWLSGIEAQMAELGIAMAVARADLVAMLKAMIEEAPDGQPFPKADLVLSGGYPAEDFARPSVDLEDEARLRLSRQRSADRAAGRTLEGPHRADLSVFHRAKAMPAALSSTGEQKALLIGLVLAHAKLVRRASGTAPILLLDEIAAHLDPGRRASLFDIVEGLGVQSFMTGTDGHLFDALGGRAQRLTVSGGEVLP